MIWSKTWWLNISIYSYFCRDIVIFKFSLLRYLTQWYCDYKFWWESLEKNCRGTLPRIFGLKNWILNTHVSHRSIFILFFPLSCFELELIPLPRLHYCNIIQRKSKTVFLELFGLAVLYGQWRDRFELLNTWVSLQVEEKWLKTHTRVRADV